MEAAVGGHADFLNNSSTNAFSGRQLVPITGSSLNVEYRFLVDFLFSDLGLSSSFRKIGKIPFDVQLHKHICLSPLPFKV